MKDLTKGYPAKVIILFAIPMIFGSIFQQLYNIADSKIVSTLLAPKRLRLSVPQVLYRTL